MTTGLHEVIAAREEVVRAALDLVRAERDLNGEDASTMAVVAAEGRLAVASRHLAQVTGSLPLSRRPQGWAEAVGDAP